MLITNYSEMIIIIHFKKLFTQRSKGLCLYKLINKCLKSDVGLI